LVEQSDEPVEIARDDRRQAQLLRERARLAAFDVQRLRDLREGHDVAIRIHDVVEGEVGHEDRADVRVLVATLGLVAGE
jgi:hypothetical protein